jgi:hypothetical protein
MLTKNFIIQEFVTPEIYKRFGENSIWFVDKRIINVAQYLRETLNVPATINNWHTGGQYKESCLRDFQTSTGAKFSQHKYGRAADIKFSGVKPEEVRDYIRKNFAVLLAMGLTTIEKDTPTWVHIDCRNTGIKTLLEVPYK